MVNKERFTIVIVFQELSKGFIDPERLEEEIEKALNIRINYNFAVDLEGNRYMEMADGSIEMETKAKDQQQHTTTP